MTPDNTPPSADMPAGYTPSPSVEHSSEAQPTPVYGVPDGGYPPPPAATYPYAQPYYGGYAPVPGPMPGGTSGYAIASLVLSILGIIPVPILLSILGIIFGHLALHEIKASNGQLEGRGLAITGLVLGYGMLALGILLACVITYAVTNLPIPAQ